jgi:hypothetical protein
MASSPKRTSPRLPQSDTLADILERVLETGIVIAGDIRVNLNDVELLTIQIRLLVCSVDKADEMGIDWWKSADFLNGAEAPSGAEEAAPTAVEEVNERLARLEDRLEQLDKNDDDPEKS